jgi:hypothetical protein
MRLDSSGNLGLGVTPSAWGTLKSIDVSTWASFAGFTNQVGVLGNAYFDGSSYRYKQTAVATRYEQNNTGSHAWYNAPSGTAGNAISFTQAMTLDAGGRLGVGTTSPSSFGVTAERGGSDSVYFTANNTSGYNFIAGVAPALGYGLLGMTTNHALAFLTNNTERARIDSSGNFLMGTTSSTARLTVVGTGLTTSFANGTAYQGVTGFGDAALGNGTWNWRSATTPGSGVAQFWTRFASVTDGGTVVHNVVIDGDLLIGTTVLAGNSNSTGLRKGSTGELLLIANDGGLFHQAVANYYLVTTAGGNTSDATLKKNVQQLSGALAKVCAIRGVNFEFIAEQKSTPDNGVQVGVIAQEVEAQYPEIVVTNEDGIKSVRYDRLVAPLIEAIKELKAEFDAYKASHP